MTTEVPTGYWVLPTGMAPDNINRHVWGIEIIWRGFYSDRRDQSKPPQHWYSVEHGGCSLSRAGNWSWQLRPFQRQQHRFTLEEARRWAGSLVDAMKVGDTTFAEWQARRP